MAIGTGTALAAASLGSSVLGGIGAAKGKKGEAPAQSVSGYGALPDFAQQGYKTLVNDAMGTYGDLRNTTAPAPEAWGYLKGAQQSYQNALAQAPNATPMFAGGDQFYDQANQFFSGSKGLIDKGTQNLTDDRFNNYLNQYMNPYQQQVLTSTTGEIQRNADLRRNQLAAEANAAGAFGTDRQGVEYGMLNRDTGRQIADTTGNLLYSGFNNAANNALQQYGTESNNALQGASIGIQGAGTAANAAGQRYQEGFNALNAQNNLTQLGIQGNQNNMNNYYNKQSFDQNNKILPSQYLGSVLNPLLGSQSSTGANPGKDNKFTTASKLLNVGTGAFSGVSNLFGGGA